VRSARAVRRVTGAPAWGVHVATAGSTTVRFASRSGSSGAGWPLPRLLVEVSRLGAERQAAPRALGSGSGAPLVHSADLRWQGCDLHVEAIRDPARQRYEVALELPPWDELASRVPAERDLWELLDVAAAASDTEHGSIGDGEALQLDAPRDAVAWERHCARHAGVLVPEDVAALHLWAASPYRRLPQSDLCVLLR
jgi:hypothetical protein